MPRRTFIALQIPGSARQRLVALGRQVAEYWPAGKVRWTGEANLHLTLRFLGDTPEDRIPALSGALDDCVAHTPPITLVSNRLSAFPDTRRPQVIWAGISGDMATLTDLQGRIETSVQALGWEPATQVFRPHLTLGRPRRGAPPPSSPDWAETSMRPIECAIDRIALIESLLQPTGATYQTLHQIQLT